MGGATGVTGNVAAVLTGAQVTGKRGSGIGPGPGHKSADTDTAAAEMRDIGDIDPHHLLSRGQMIDHIQGYCIANACMLLSNAIQRI